MYYSNLAISVLVVCTYGANESTYDILAGSSSTATHQGIYFDHDGEICLSLIPLELKPVATVPSTTAP